jgi:hypothetical protein
LEDGVASIGGNKGLILTCGPSATGTGQDFFIFVSTEANQTFTKGVQIFTGTKTSKKAMKPKDKAWTMSIQGDIQTGVDGTIYTRVATNTDTEIDKNQILKVGIFDDTTLKNLRTKYPGDKKNTQVNIIGTKDDPGEINDYVAKLKIAKDDAEGTITGVPAQKGTTVSITQPFVEPVVKYNALASLLEKIITMLDSHVHTETGAVTGTPLVPINSTVWQTLKDTFKSITTEVQ